MAQGTLAQAILVVTAASLGALSASITTARAKNLTHHMNQATVPEDHLLRIVGEGGLMLKLHASPSGRIVASNGLFTYTAMPDGALEPVEKASVYETFFGQSDSLSGYVIPLPAARTFIPGAHGDVLHYQHPQTGMGYIVEIHASEKPELLGTAGGFENGVEWNGVFVALAYGNDGPVVWASKGTPPFVPETWMVGQLTLGHDHALVALGQDEHGGAAIIWKTREAHPFSVDLPDHRSLASCHLLSAFDGEVYASCDESKPTYEFDAPPPQQKLFALVKNDHWEPLKTPRTFTSKASVAPDGTLYFAEPRGVAVSHCPRNSDDCTMLPMESDPTTRPLALWRQFGTDMIERHGELSWLRVELDKLGASPLDRIENVFARGENDIWAIARTTGGARAILHTGRIRDRVRLLEPAEVVVSSHNERPPASWAGHCDEVFVALAEGPLGKPLDPWRIQREAVASVVGTTFSGFDWELVQGRLYDREVAGVVFLRSTGDAKLETMEKKVEELIARYTTSPMDQPRASCTLPVLDRVL